jgi:hypothetical protein
MGYNERRHGGHHHHGHDCGHAHHGHDHHHHDHGHDHDHDHDNEFDEKRVIDTIVDLVGERVERILDHRSREPQRHEGGGGDEKRIIDLIVSLVSEHVREIVVEELDRRLGRGEAPAALPPGGPSGDEPR